MSLTTDFKKRNTIKTLSAAATVAMTPGLASAVCSTSHKPVSEISNMPEGLHLSFNGTADADIHVATLSNTSDETITVKHVSPGLVASEGSLFDINTLLANGPLTLKAGESRAVSMTPVAKNARETAVPAGTIHPHAVTVSSRYNAYPFENKVRVAQTRRMLLS